jgi:hypothetical protein
MTNILDDLVRDAHASALEELKHLLSRIDYPDMTPCEVVAFVALLRPVFDRTFEESAPPVAPVLKLIPVGTR